VNSMRPMPLAAANGSRRTTPPVRLARAVTVLIFAVLMAGVRPITIGGDTYWYVLDIESALGRPLTASPQIWEFAHVLWRPLGRAFAGLFLPLVTPHFGGDVQVSITFLLMCLNLAAALACGLLLQQAIWRMTGKPWLATMVTAAFFCLGPVLSYSRSGTPYLVGLVLSSLAVYLAASRSVISWRRAVTCGLFAATAALVWVPYVLSIPAVLLVSPVLNCHGESLRSRVRFAAFVCLTAGIAIAAFYAMAFVCRDISSWADFRKWMLPGQAYSRNRTLLRFPSGFARGFYYLGDDSVWFKWYLFRDPYAGVKLVDLIGVMASKLALFYASLASLVLLLWRSAAGKRLLLLAAVIVVPHVCLAIAYESGDPGRYVPLLAILMLLFGYAIAGPDLRVWARTWLALLCCAPIAVNVATALARSTGRDSAREASLAAAPASSAFYVLNLRDDLFGLRYPGVFRATRLQMAPILTLDPSSTQARYWRGNFACTVLAGWDQDLGIWVTRRVLSARPQRSWMWIDGDTPGINWEGVNRFFAMIERGDERGGPDGFFLLPETDRNRIFLNQALPAGGRQNCPAVNPSASSE
jgi:hypothetical protein